ncbi:MAG: hypothetical protein LBN74_00860, partial [Prevotella sp.]|nr:hypothetical protein [Prevotella sp.]
MSKIKEYIKQFSKFIYKYKFTISVLAYIGLVAFLPINMKPSLPMALHVISFLFLLNILSKTK